MLVNEVMHTIKACSDYGYALNIAGRRISTLIKHHRENKFQSNKTIILQTGITEAAFLNRTIHCFYNLATSLGTSYYHCEDDDQIFIIGSEQEANAVMKSWELIKRCYMDYRSRFYRRSGNLTYTFDLFLSEIEDFPVIQPSSIKTRNILLSKDYSEPPAKKLIYDEHETIIDSIPSDVREGCNVEFCYYKRCTPIVKYSSCGSIYHEDNAYKKPIIKKGKVIRTGDKLRVKYDDGQHEKTRSLDRIYIRDVITSNTN